MSTVAKHPTGYEDDANVWLYNAVGGPTGASTSVTPGRSLLSSRRDS